MESCHARVGAVCSAVGRHAERHRKTVSGPLTPHGKAPASSLQNQWQSAMHHCALPRLVSKNHAPQSPESNRRPYCTRLACLSAFIITFAAGDNNRSDRVMIPNASIWHGISSGSTVTIPCAA
jgi:hypothetical protein